VKGYRKKISVNSGAILLVVGILETRDDALHFDVLTRFIGCSFIIMKIGNMFWVLPWSNAKK
jgi:hypothetical protein